ncbi:MAG: hypothetical protein IJ091_07740 [Oscillospiraceae bacterium]|nr:hypothetical protein [Oscillospiraceae bacterium]
MLKWEWKTVTKSDFPIVENVSGGIMKFNHWFRLQHADEHTRIYESDGILMRIDFIKGMLRVALIKNEDILPTFSIDPAHKGMTQEGRDKLALDGFELCSTAVTENGNSVCFRHCGLDFRIELMNFRIAVSSDKGILYQDRNGLAYNFDGELGEGSVHYTRREENQYIYGLGDKSGGVDKNLQHYKLDTNDAMGFRAEYSDPLYKYLPFYICENKTGSYGIYYDTYSEGEIDFGREHDNYYEAFNSIRYEEENMVFYILFGEVREIIRNFIHMTGGIGRIPDWAFQYCGSTMEYTDAKDADKRLRSFIDHCEEHGIQAGGFYMSSGYTQIGDKRYVFHWNRDKIADPKGLSDYFKSKGLKIVPNIKPAFLDDHPMYDKIAKNGWFLHYPDGTPAKFPFWGGNASYLDFTHPGAYVFWKRCVKEKLVDLGYEDVWNDNNEYDIHDREVLAHGFKKEIPARLIKPLFSYLMTKASREACEEVNPEPFVVTRCAIAGSQRISTTWTGDNYTSFGELRYNHYQAMTMAISGFCFFGPDIGGFSGPKPGRELFMRWLQYGVFLPRFVLHSWKIGEESTMPWLYPDRMDSVRRIFDLRQQLVPYLKDQMEKCIEKNTSLIAPVFLRDKDYDKESDAFMCGDRILACPIFDEGINEVTVRFPKSSRGFRLRGEGERIDGEAIVKVTCTIDDLPVWFVEGP